MQIKYTNQLLAKIPRIRPLQEAQVCLNFTSYSHFSYSALSKVLSTAFVIGLGRLMPFYSNSQDCFMSDYSVTLSDAQKRSQNLSALPDG